MSATSSASSVLAFSTGSSGPYVDYVVAPE
jgi:hypothetical protein